MSVFATIAMTLASRIDNCDPIKGTIIRQGQFWIKYFESANEAGVDSPYFIHPFCPYNYCVSPSLPVSIDLSLSNGSDAQCANNRGGFLCGRCLQGYSLSLGSSKCMECSNSWHGPLAGILIAFIVAGVLLVISLLYFNVTVAVGTLNSIIFFAIILNINRSEYFSQRNLTFVQVFISWLNLDIGFDTCFVDGMDTYIKTWLQLAFPLYIIVLVLLIIWISSCSVRFSKLIGKRNPVATLATLILLSYAKLLQIVIASFSFVSLTFPNGQEESRWLRDPNIRYKSGKLIALVIVAIIILVVGLIYTALLFSWQWLLPLSKYKIFVWTKNHKLHTFIETYNTPYTPKHRYWTALFLIVRVLLYLISALNESTDPRITLMCTIIVMVCIIIYKTLWTVTIYKNVILNAIESFVLLNITTFSVITLYTFTDLDQLDKQILQTVAAYLSVGSVLVICLLVIMYHVYRYGSFKLYTKISSSKAGQHLAGKLSYVSSQNYSTACDNTLFNAIDDDRPRYIQLFDKRVQPTSSEISLTNSEIVAECNRILNEPERQRSTSDTVENEHTHYNTDVPQRSSTLKSQDLPRRKTEPPIHCANIDKKPLLEDEF